MGTNQALMLITVQEEDSMVRTSICGDEVDLSLHEQQILMKFIRNIKEIHGLVPNSNKEANRLYAELLLCVCWHTENI